MTETLHRFKKEVRSCWPVFRASSTPVFGVTWKPISNEARSGSDASAGRRKSTRTVSFVALRKGTIGGSRLTLKAAGQELDPMERLYKAFWDRVLGWLRPSEERDLIPVHEARVGLSGNRHPLLDLFVYDDIGADNQFRFSVNAKGNKLRSPLQKLAPGHYQAALPLSAPGDYRIDLVEDRRGRRLSLSAHRLQPALRSHQRVSPARSQSRLVEHTSPSQRRRNQPQVYRVWRKTILYQYLSTIASAPSHISRGPFPV